MDAIRRIVIIGSGNAATQLALGFKSTGYTVSQIYSRKLKHARRLAGLINSDPIDDLSKVDMEADLILISVTDDAIAEVSKQIPKSFEGIIAHTSGFTPMDSLYGQNIGVFYPLQTMTIDKEVKWSSIPICVEGESKEIAKTLKKLAKGISGKVKVVDSQQRRIMHLAAVFAANYSNFMYVLAEDILKENDLDLELLGPLIKEVSKKSRKGDAWSNQTGPAIRGDKGVIDAHLKLLEDKPELKEVYSLLAESIRNYDR